MEITVGATRATDLDHCSYVQLIQGFEVPSAFGRLIVLDEIRIAHHRDSVRALSTLRAYRTPIQARQGSAIS
jgi:hypothetical protein